VRAPLTGKPVVPVVPGKARTVSELLAAMARTGFQGRALGRALDVLETMVSDPDVAIFLGLAGSLATAGQSKIVEWLIDNGFVDALVATGANISEDLLEAVGATYFQCADPVDDRQLLREGFNRYHDVCASEADYVRLVELIAAFLRTLEPGSTHTPRDCLRRFGSWLSGRGHGGIVAAAARRDVPVFCPALMDSAYGDAVLVARGDGHRVVLDAAAEYVEFMNLDVRETAIVYVGGGVPKDLIQSFAVSADFLHASRRVPGRGDGVRRAGVDKTYYPHKYGVQITTDLPQWGGSSGATFAEGVSWGKLSDLDRFVQCHCDATIALPLLAQGLAERVTGRRNRRLITDA
jgi:deoxyhypusine synthase